jgi:tRNA(Ile)-lysidine synthase
MVLLDAMVRIARVHRLQLGVAHFDHGLRGEASREDAAFVVDQAKLRGVKSYVGHGDVKKYAQDHKLSLEEAARKCRYAFLERVARKHGFAVVMTGHTADDNAETLLMNVLRGSGVSGLAAIPPVRVLGKGVILCRPLLGLDRTEIQGYAAEGELEWREDESNASARFTRNRIRRDLIPVLQEFNPAIINTLNTTAEIMRGLEQYLSQTVETAMKRVVIAADAERVELGINHLKHYLPAIQAEVVQRAISKNFLLPPFSYGAVTRALGLMWKETGTKAELGGTISALRDRDTLCIRRELPPPEAVEKKFDAGQTVTAGRMLLKTKRVNKSHVKINKKPTLEFVDTAKLSGAPLVVRTWREGDRFQPLGMEGEKKVSDFLIDQKVPLDKKAGILVVADGDRIVWVCGMRLDDRFKIEEGTEHALRMEIVPASEFGQ